MYDWWVGRNHLILMVPIEEGSEVLDKARSLPAFVGLTGREGTGCLGLLTAEG